MKNVFRYIYLLSDLILYSSIVESASHVSSLVFSSDGSQLLVVRSMGTVQLFSKGAGLHDWSVTHTCDWGGEDILHINFFHGGIRVSSLLFEISLFFWRNKIEVVDIVKA